MATTRRTTSNVAPATPADAPTPEPTAPIDEPTAPDISTDTVTDPANDAAPVTSGAFVFEDVIVGVASREPNPFTDIVKALTVGSAEGKAFIVPGTSEKDNQKQPQYINAALRKIRRQLTEAGDLRTPPVSIRMIVKPHGDNSRVEIKAVTKLVK